jgi:hypothetical protein
MFVQPYAVFNKEIEIMGALVSLQRPLCFSENCALRAASGAWKTQRSTSGRRTREHP